MLLFFFFFYSHLWIQVLNKFKGGWEISAFCHHVAINLPLGLFCTTAALQNTCQFALTCQSLHLRSKVQTATLELKIDTNMTTCHIENTWRFGLLSEQKPSAELIPCNQKLYPGQTFIIWALKPRILKPCSLLIFREGLFHQ